MIKLSGKFFNRIASFSSEYPFYSTIAIIGLIGRFAALWLLRHELTNAFGLQSPVLAFTLASFLNIIFETPLHAITYAQVGTLYEGGSNYALGSLLYTLFYLVNCTILVLVMLFHSAFIWWLWLIFLTAYIILFVVLGLIKHFTF